MTRSRSYNCVEYGIIEATLAIYIVTVVLLLSALLAKSNASTEVDWEPTDVVKNKYNTIVIICLFCSQNDLLIFFIILFYL